MYSALLSWCLRVLVPYSLSVFMPYCLMPYCISVLVAYYFLASLVA